MARGYLEKSVETYTAWKVSKYGVFSGPNFPVFEHFSRNDKWVKWNFLLMVKFVGTLVVPLMVTLMVAIDQRSSKWKHLASVCG